MLGNKHLSAEKITYFQNILLVMKQDIKEKRNEINYASPTERMQESVEFTNHPADMGTEQFEQERAAGFDRMAQEQLQDIEYALQRIENGTYGLSDVSGKSIPLERLEAVPTATMLVEEEKEEERNRRI